MNKDVIKHKITNLEAIVQEAQAISAPALFFPLLRDFAYDFLQEPLLMDIINQTKTNVLVDSLPIMQEHAVEELKNAADIIVKYLNQENIHLPQIKKELDIFNSKITTPHVSNFFLATPLIKIIHMLLNDGLGQHTAFVKTFGSIHYSDYEKKKYISLREAFPKYNDWQNEYSCLDQEKTESAMFALQQIMDVYEHYDYRTHDKIIKQDLKNGIDTTKREQKQLVLIGYAYDDTEKNTPLFPSIKKCKYYMKKVVRTLKSNCTLIDSAITKPPVFQVYYDHEKRVLHIDHMKANLSNAVREHKLVLSTLTPNGDPCIKPIPLDTIIPQFFDDGHTNRKQENRKYACDAIYSTRQSFKKRIKKLLKDNNYPEGISFLVCPTEISNMPSGTISWNPEYKYISPPILN